MPAEPADELIETEGCCWLDGLRDDPEEVRGASDEPLDGRVGRVLADGASDCTLSEVGAIDSGEPSAGKRRACSSGAVSDVLPDTARGLAAIPS